MAFGNFGGNSGGNFGGNFGNLGAEARKLRRSPLAIVVVFFLVASAILISISSFYADLLWFRSVGFTSVWKTTLFTKATLFIVVGLLTAAIVLANVMIAYRGRPIYAPMAVEADNLERYRSEIEPKRRFFAIAIFIAVFYIKIGRAHV